MSWEERARCNDFDPELFFTAQARTERRAKSVCARCPVAEQCLTFALDTHMEFGIWGGTNGKERRALLHARSFDRRTRSLERALVG